MISQHLFQSSVSGVGIMGVGGVVLKLQHVEVAITRVVKSGLVCLDGVWAKVKKASLSITESFLPLIFQGDAGINAHPKKSCHATAVRSMVY